MKIFFTEGLLPLDVAFDLIFRITFGAAKRGYYDKEGKNAAQSKIGTSVDGITCTDRKNIRTGKDWTNILAKHRAVIESNQELNDAILAKYPTKLEEVKNLRYTSDIEKSIACLNAISPTDG